MLEILTVGARVKYAWETTPGVRPTSGYTVLPDVNQAPEISMSVSGIDVSSITDRVTRYKPGRQDPGSEQSFTLNHTDEVIEIWNTLAAQAPAKEADGLHLWFEYRYPGADNSYFWAGWPQELGSSGIGQNALSTLPAGCVFAREEGWAPHSQELSLSASTATVSAGSGSGHTATITVSNAVGTVSVRSSAPGRATATVSSSTVTITGVSAGLAVITVTDEAGGEATVTVTVTDGE